MSKSRWIPYKYANTFYMIDGKQFRSYTKQILIVLKALYEETATTNEEIENLLRRNSKRYLDIVKVFANAIEAKDRYTAKHCGMVKEYSLGIAAVLGLSNKERMELEYGSLLHDIGKIGIPEQILIKQSRLTKQEYKMIKTHPIIGYEILEDFHFLENSQRIVYEHHERYDGKGYPNGLKGDQINHLARIVCVADAYDAMTSNRVYRKISMTKEKAVLELIKNKWTQFDADYVDALIRWLGNQDNAQKT